MASNEKNRTVFFLLIKEKMMLINKMNPSMYFNIKSSYHTDGIIIQTKNSILNFLQGFCKLNLKK